MKVWVLIADTITDVAGELLAAGEVVGVYGSKELAEQVLSEIPVSYIRNTGDYTIEEKDVLR